MLDDTCRQKVCPTHALRGSPKEGTMRNTVTTFAQIVATVVEKKATETGKPVPMTLDPVPPEVPASTERILGRGKGSRPRRLNRQRQDATSVAFAKVVRNPTRPLRLPRVSPLQVESYPQDLFPVGGKEPSNIRPYRVHYA